ncbi:MAG: transporter substrate-binding domain-containing protein [Rhodoplanes sp.]|uniref:transporter substrate-binding domain-containing protein n=1 Tax=Rhodoplanes sp. TaxID=1968906 RepID=UPI0017CF39CF|nr:transporter substrate-binding domain-containing protein [Rhodoplanes sp.]NVO14515.1 transporter substrate-binding domain-containing protein [Rhodoplanes sp.]
MALVSRRLFASFVAVAMLAATGGLAAADPEAKLILAPSGKLRAGLYPGTPTSYLAGKDGGAPRGVGYELGKAMAEKLGVPYEPVVFSKNAEVLEAVTSGAVDVAFTNASVARAKVMDFGPAYLDIELGYLVPKGSPVTAVDTVDAQGVRVGVTTGSSSDSVLSRELKNAEVVRVETVLLAAEMMAAGKLDAFATNKATLFEMAEKVPGSKVLDGRWGMERHAIAIPKNRDAGLHFVRTFTAEVKASGLVAGAVERAGLRGAQVSEMK